MMLRGRSSGSDAAHEPRVVQIQISRYSRALPRKGEPLEFLVAIHMEGTASTDGKTITLNGQHAEPGGGYMTHRAVWKIIRWPMPSILSKASPSSSQSNEERAGQPARNPKHDT